MTEETTGFLASGRMVGDYRLISPLGRGGMGEVFRARDEKLGRDVAIKALPAELTSDERARTRFVRETRAAARIVHPYVATVFDVVEQDAQLYLVMELIDGEPIDIAVERRAAGSGEMARFGLEITEALMAIHDAGFIHRDLKPANILVTRDGHVKVMDFGLAQRLKSPAPVGDGPERVTDGASLTEPGAGVGTVAYMSPEQVRGDELDARSDLFSLGIVLYEAVTGMHPFIRESIYETASAILHEAPGYGPEPATLSNSGPLRSVVLRLLEKDPAARYQTSAEVAADLRVLARGDTLPAAPRPVERRKALLWILGTGALLVAAGASLWLAKGPRTSGTFAVRPALAVLPFEDRTGTGDGEDRGVMISDLLAAELAGVAVRSLGSERLEPILAGIGGAALNRATRVDAVGHKTPARWIVAGSVYKEGDSYHAAIDLFASGTSTPTVSFTEAAGSVNALVDLARPRILAVVAPAADRASSGERDVWPPHDEEAALAYQKARRASRDFRFFDAMTLLDRALELDPDYLPAAILRARVLDAAGFGKRAGSALDTARRIAERGRLAPDSRWAAELAAAEATMHDRVDDAVSARRHLAERTPDDPEAWLALAGALLDAGKPDLGITAAEKAAALDAFDPRIQLVHGRLAIARATYDEARVLLDRCETNFAGLGSAIGVGRVRQARGDLCRARSQWPDALAAYQSAAQRYLDARFDGGVARARLDEATVQIFLGHFADAETLYGEVRDSAAKRADWRPLIQVANALGASYFSRGDYRAAERQFRKALEDCRDLDNEKLSLDPTLNLASLLGSTGRPGEAELLAREALRIAHERGPRGHEVVARTLLADTASQAGRLGEAIQDYEAAAALGESAGIPIDQRFWTLLFMAHVLEPAGELGRAVDANGRALRLAEESQQKELRAFGLLQRGMLRSALGDWDGADKDFAQCASLSGQGDNAMAYLAARLTLARGIRAARSGNSGDAERLLAEALTKGQRSGGEGVEMPARTWRAFLSIGEGAPRRGIQDAKYVLESRTATADERVHARCVLARCLAGSSRPAEAALEARTAMEEASRMGMPLRVAEAAAVMERLPAASRPPDLEAIRAEGRKALHRFLDNVPEADRDHVRRRAELQEVFDSLKGV